MRSMRDLSSPAGQPDVTITEYGWNVAEHVAEQEASLEQVQAGQSMRNGRTEAMNRRP